MPNRAERRAAARAAQRAGSAFGIASDTFENAAPGNLFTAVQNAQHIFGLAPDFQANVNGERLRLRNSYQGFKDWLETATPIDFEQLDHRDFTFVQICVFMGYSVLLTRNVENLDEEINRFAEIAFLFAAAHEIDVEEVYEHPDTNSGVQISYLMFKMLLDIKTRVSSFRDSFVYVSPQYFANIVKPYVRLISWFDIQTWVAAGATFDTAVYQANLRGIVLPFIIERHLYNLGAVVDSGRIEDKVLIETESTVKLKEKHADFIAKAIHRAGNAYAFDDVAELRSVIADVAEKYNATITGVFESEDPEYVVYRNEVGTLTPDVEEEQKLSALLASLYEFFKDLKFISTYELNHELLDVSIFADAVAVVCPAVGASTWKLFKGVYPKEAMKAYLDNGHPYYSYPHVWDEEHKRWDGEPD